MQNLHNWKCKYLCCILNDCFLWLFFVMFSLITDSIFASSFHCLFSDKFFARVSNSNVSSWIYSTPKNVYAYGITWSWFDDNTITTFSKNKKLWFFLPSECSEQSNKRFIWCKWAIFVFFLVALYLIKK